MKRLDPKHIFLNADISHDFQRKSVRGGFTTVFAQFIHFIVGIAGTAILARILTPDDYGLIGMVAVVVHFATMFKDAGLSMATVQKEEISHEQISTLFWVNVLISIGLGICIVVAAPLVATFYGNQKLTAITALLAISFVMNGLVIQHQALLRRHMRFNALAVIQVGSQLVALLITITLAWWGWSYWALVANSIISAMVTILLTLYFCPWVPGTMRKRTGSRNMVRFGGYITGFNLVNYFARNLDNILVGKFINAEALGYYSKGYQILMLPIRMVSGPLSGVAVPTLSRLSHNHVELHRYYLHILYLLALFASPIAAFSFVASNDLVMLLLGPQWEPVADIFRYLAIGAVLQPLYNTQAWLHIAKGQPERVFYWGLVGTPVIICSFVVGLYWGVNGVALCYSIAVYIVTIASLWYAGRSANLGFMRIVKACYKPLVSCFVTAGILSYLDSVFMAELGRMVSLSINAVSFVIVYFLVLFALYGGLKPLHDIRKLKEILVKQ